MKFIIVSAPKCEAAMDFARSLGFDKIVPLAKLYPYQNGNPEPNSAEAHELAMVRSTLADDITRGFTFDEGSIVVIVTEYQDNPGVLVEHDIHGSLEILPKSILKDTIQVYVCNKHGLSQTVMRVQLYLKSRFEPTAFDASARFLHLLPFSVPAGHAGGNVKVP